MAQTVKNCLQCGRPGLNPWVGKMPWRRAWQPSPLLLPGEFLQTEEPGGLQSMGHKELDTTEQLSTTEVRWLRGKEPPCQCRRCESGFSPRVGKIPWRGKWHPTPVFLLGKAHGWRSLVGYRPRGQKQLSA